jgi:hypothetical protein
MSRMRAPEDITFPVAPTFETHGVSFVHAAATRLDLVEHRVGTTVGDLPYDFLVIATGYRNDFDVIPGLGPKGHAYTITTLEDAIHAGEGWRRLLDEPGDVVVGAAQGAGCFGAAYEYLFNVSLQLRRAGLKKRVKMTYVSAEPFLGHFGIGGLPHGEALLGMFLRKEGSRRSSTLPWSPWTRVGWCSPTDAPSTSPTRLSSPRSWDRKSSGRPATSPTPRASCGSATRTRPRRTMTSTRSVWRRQ